MRNVVLAGACRTPIGVLGGSLSTLTAAELGAIVIKEAIKRAGVKPEMVDEIYMGCAVQAGQKPNVARQAALEAGIPVEIPATTINVLCGSGLQSVNMAARMVAGGFAEIIVAGGTESMSTAPYLLKKGRFGYSMGNDMLQDALYHDALVDAFHQYHMGVTAENVAEKWGLKRKELDCFAAESQKKCIDAQHVRRFREEIVPVEMKNGLDIVDTDESPRVGITEEKLSKLRPAFQDQGVVTAGNSSGINDGASAIVVMSEKAAELYQVKGMGKWLGGEMAGVAPSIMGIGPVPSTERLLKKLGFTMDDIDLVEANEAFAAQSLAVSKELNFDMSRLNVNGGAIALGHPLGNTGCRILVTLLHEMEKRNAKRGLATLCIGGGMGCSTIVERGSKK